MMFIKKCHRLVQGSVLGLVRNHSMPSRAKRIFPQNIYSKREPADLAGIVHDNRYDGVPRFFQVVDTSSELANGQVDDPERLMP